MYKYGEILLTNNFTLAPYTHETIIPPLPDDTEGHAIIENLSEFSTGLAIEVRDKKDAGDHSAYVPAYIAGSVLFAPWFSYRYQLLRSPVVSTILYLLLLNNE